MLERERDLEWMEKGRNIYIYMHILILTILSEIFQSGVDGKSGLKPRKWLKLSVKCNQWVTCEQCLYFRLHVFMEHYLRH